MPRLTDAQLVILSTAAQRKEGAALPLPKSLRINKGAATAVVNSLIRKGLIEEKPAAATAEAWRETEDRERITLAVTEAGLAAIGVEGADSSDEPADIKVASKKPPTTTGQLPQGAGSATLAAPAVRPGTKQALLIDLLQRKRGASIDEIVEATGWQAHSVRGAISGTLKKKLGLSVSSERLDDRGRVYRIAGQA